MNSPTLRTYWKRHYVTDVDPNDIERAITIENFTSGGASREVVCLLTGKESPNLLVSQGSGGHAYVFAELAYLMHLKGYNVFVMPKHGGHAIPDLMRRHADALAYIARSYGDRTGVFAEGLGGFVVFYLALAGGPMKSIALQNAPAILTEERWHRAISAGAGGGRRERFLPVLRALSRALPGVKVPLWLYLDFGQLIDTRETNRAIEERLVNKGYKNDPDFDRWYPLGAIMSLVTAAPPRPLSALAIPTLFMVARRGFIPPAYFEDLYDRLPPITKEMVEVDGSVYWMLSNPREAARMICRWFDQTMAADVGREFSGQQSELSDWRSR